MSGITFPCPALGCPGHMHRVVDSRSAPYGIRRRRQCSQCNTRVTTMEIAAMRFQRVEQTAEIDELVETILDLDENDRELVYKLITRLEVEVFSDGL